MRRNIIKTICFLFIFGILLMWYHRVFSFKYGDGIYDVTVFYELPEDSVDILCLGSSHTFENINPDVMWKEYGYAAFDLCSSVQPMWNTYYYLKEALKTQTPQLVVLDAFCVNETREYLDDSRIIKGISGLKWSVNKVQALMVSAPRERWFEFGIECIQNHNRYKGDLSKEDFCEYKGNPEYYTVWKGMGNNFNTQALEKPQIINDGSKRALPAKTEWYYRKIIELCQQENIPMLIVVSPYAGYVAQHMQMYNEAAAIANDYGVEFINFNEYYDQINLDFTTDIADQDHLNYIGNVKYTEYLADYISTYYNVSDRKTDGTEKYDSWDKASHYYDNSIFNYQLKTQNDYYGYLSMLTELTEDYEIYIIVPINQVSDNEEIKELFDRWNFNYLYNTETYAMITASDVTIFDKENEFPYISDRGVHRLIFSDIGVNLDGVDYSKTDDGIRITVYDTYNGVVADAVCISNMAVKR